MITYTRLIGKTLSELTPAETTYLLWLPSHFHVHSQLPLVHSVPCCPLSADLWWPIVHESSPPSNGPLSSGRWEYFAFLIWMQVQCKTQSLITMFSNEVTKCMWILIKRDCPTNNPAFNNSPGSLSSAAPCLSPFGRSLAPCQHCFALLALALGTSESNAQTVLPTLSEWSDSLSCRNRWQIWTIMQSCG